MSSNFRVHAALFFVALIYAANYSLSKDVMPRYLGPLGIVALRIGGALLFFSIVKYFVVPHERIVGAADNWRSVACGVCGIGVNQLLFFSGLNLTSPISASLLQTVAPLVVVLASVFLLKERLTAPRLVGIGLGAAGAVALILSRHESSAIYPHALLGNVCILLNAAVFGLYLVLVAPLMRKYNAFTVLVRIFLVGAVIALPIGARQALAADYARFPAYIWAEVAYMVVFVTIIAYLLNNWALRHAPPALLGAYIYIQPALAAGIAVALGRDHLSWAKVGQGLLIFSGVWLVGRRGKVAAGPVAYSSSPSNASAHSSVSSGSTSDGTRPGSL